jgi:hypothetical protein
MAALARKSHPHDGRHEANGQTNGAMRDEVADPFDASMSK